MKKIRAYHFINEDRKLRYSDNRIVEAGKTYSCEGKVRLCSNGLHASIDPFDALKFAPGPILCLVDIWGDVQREDDKIVGRHRHVLSMYDMSRELHEFACNEAFRALMLIGCRDKSCWNAIQAKLDWLDGKITDEELYSAAHSAASYTVRYAAHSAAHSAAYFAASYTVHYAAYFAVHSAAYEDQREEFNAIVDSISWGHKKC